jgi:hypothetical protein
VTLVLGLAIGGAALFAVIAAVARDRWVNVILAIGWVVGVSLLMWVASRNDAFAANCSAQSGRVLVVSRAVYGQLCVDADGRVVDIPPP